MLSSTASLRKYPRRVIARYAGIVLLMLLVGVAVPAQGVGPTRRIRAAVVTPMPAHPAAAQIARAESAAEAPADAQTALIKQYCATCHSDRGKAGGLTLQAFDVGHAEDAAEVSEKIIKKLRLNMMPPPGAKRPERPSLVQLADALEAKIDASADRSANRGYRPFPRLTRDEYQRAVGELLAVEVDVKAFLPPDTMSAGFENVADVQTFSPTLQQGYLRAAATIATLALGDPGAGPTEVTHKIQRSVNQMKHVDGAPWGTRGGLVVNHVFPADGEYRFRILLYGNTVGDLFGSAAGRDEQLDISIDGERVLLVDVPYTMTEWRDGLTITTAPVFIKSGQRRLAASFLQKADGPIDDLIAPLGYTLADGEDSDDVAVTVLPHLRDFSITGPLRVTGVTSDTPTRRKIFVCYPDAPAKEAPCARQILTRLATNAYRRPASSKDVEPLMRFFEAGRKPNGFEAGIKLAVQALLASPHFLFESKTLPQTHERDSRTVCPTWRSHRGYRFFSGRGSQTSSC